MSRSLTAALCIASAISSTASATAAEPGRRALLVGINAYKWSGPVHKDPAQDFPNLAGAAGDAILLKSILTTKYGFRDEDVIVLTDAAATRDAILNTFQSHLIAKSAPGDVALFYYAGHGSTSGTGDALQDTIVPYDSRDPDGKVFDILSSDLHTLFLSLLAKTQNVTSILDSCYSDTTVRGGVTRSIRADTRVRPAAPQTRGGPVSLNPITPVVRISASRADQESEEYTQYMPDGNTTQHGLMSYELFHELQTATDKTTWRDVMDKTRTQVVARNASQEPQIEAPDLDTRIFGGVGLAASEPYLLVTPGTSVQLNAGSALALAPGTGLDVYPPGTRDFGGPPVAKLKVTKVLDQTSEATVVSGMGGEDLDEGSRAVVRSVPATAFQFHIFFEPGNPRIDAVQKSALMKVAGAVTGDRKTADAVVRFDKGSFRMERRDGEQLSPAVKATDADAVDHVVAQLTQWARWNQLLTNKGSDPVLQMKITDPKGAPVEAVPDGAQISLSICNTGTQPYFTRVVFFGSDGTIQPLQLDSDGVALAAGKCTPEKPLGTMTVDGDRKVSLDFLKAFATLDKIDLEPFTATAVRGDPDPAKWSAVTKMLKVSK